MLMNRRSALGRGAAMAFAALFAGSAYSKTRRLARRGTVVKRVVRRDETILRLGGQGDNFHMSWGADNTQFVANCDGLGWFEKPTEYYNSRLFTVSGDPEHATFRDVPTYPILPRRIDEPSYYGFGTIAVDGRIYQYMSTINYPFYKQDRVLRDDLRFVGAKLICSPDNGHQWLNQDGSTPVRWESWNERTRRSMIFYEEEQESFSYISILQMGKDYALNRDGFIYLYAPNGNVEGQMNQLVLARVPKASVLDRSQYEFFAGTDPRGGGQWSRNISSREAVHTFPAGWVNTNHADAGDHPYSWIPSVTYNPALGLYMMANWGTGCSSDGLWFEKPSYLGIWTAAQPWGPWDQVHEESSWTPAGGRDVRAYAPQIAPGWVSKDGRSFWLVWGEYQLTDPAAFARTIEERKATPNPSAEDEIRWAIARKTYRPYYSFNTQRVDLILQ